VELVSILRSDLFGDLARMKEEHWVSELVEVYGKQNLRVHPNIKFKYDEEGDVDLLLLIRKPISGWLAS